MSEPAAPFLTAEWRWLAMLNYEIEPAVLQPFVPTGTELDSWQGKAFVSVVAFRFLHTRVAGWWIPFHADFDEINLRFYVRRLAGTEWRRGVVFIKEIVPRAAIAWVARRFYNENYVALPMRHVLELGGAAPRVRYAWDFQGRENRIELEAQGEAAAVETGSGEEFITEHYWGYARQADGGTVEYQVEHPRWQVWSAALASLHCDVAAMYGNVFAAFLAGRPASAFLADGSAVRVHRGRRI